MPFIYPEGVASTIQSHGADGFGADHPHPHIPADAETLTIQARSSAAPHSDYLSGSQGTSRSRSLVRAYKHRMTVLGADASGMSTDQLISVRELKQWNLIASMHETAEIAEWRQYGFTPLIAATWLTYTSVTGPASPYLITTMAPRGLEFLVHAAYPLFHHRDAKSAYSHASAPDNIRDVTARVVGMGARPEMTAAQLKLLVFEAQRWREVGAEEAPILSRAKVPVEYATKAYVSISGGCASQIIEGFQNGVPAEWVREALLTHS